MSDTAALRAIEAALAAADPARAATLAAAALAAGERDALLFHVLAWRSETDGDYAAAIAHLEEARSLAPGDAELLTASGAVLRKAGRLGDAVRMLDAAVAAAPRSAAAWLERGYAFHGGGALDDAAESYHTAARLDPGCAAAFAGFAQVAALLGFPVAVRRFAAKALAIDPREATALLALAAVDVDDGAFEEAIAALAGLLADDALPLAQRNAAAALLGRAHERAGNRDAAFAAFRDAKTGFVALHRPGSTAESAETHVALVESTIAALARTDPAAWRGTPPPPPVAGAAATHIFLLGYPRSGNTLVENILASAAGVEAIEERPTLADADRAFLVPADGLARLAATHGVALAPFRVAYWEKIAAVGAEAAGKILVDMDPFKSLQLPIIARLFPDARVVLLRRDPRDVVWSCFRTQFAPSAVAFEFTSLERAAYHYDATMRLIEQCLAVLPLTVEIVRYEDLVADFDGVTRRLCDFTGVDWHPDMRHFERGARTRGAGTASAAQVRKPLYDGGGQWRAYALHLAPVLPRLAPWVEKFGYPPD